MYAISLMGTCARPANAPAPPILLGGAQAPLCPSSFQRPAPPRPEDKDLPQVVALGECLRQGHLGAIPSHPLALSLTSPAPHRRS